MASKKGRKTNVIAAKDDAGGLGVNHTPIIITGGSTAIEYDSERYTRVANTNNVRSNNPLHLRSLQFVNLADPLASHVCFIPRAGMRYEIVVTCRRAAQADLRITFTGGPGAGQNELVFSHTEFVESATFPPETDHGRRQGQAARQIAGLVVNEISPDGASILVHRCNLIPNSGICRFVIEDRF